MPASTKVVPDSNIYIAAALNKSYCHDWLFGAADPAAVYQLYTSEAILSEVAHTLINKFTFRREAAVLFLNGLDKVIYKVRPSLALQVARDPNDNMILECAVEANAELIVSFDKDLLSLKQYEDIRIVHPSVTKYWFPRSES